MPQKPLILVVDDDGPILILMKNLLREFGFEVLTAANGPQAIETARQDSPSLVLVDRNMPGMSGDEVIRALRSQPGDEHLPILILSGEPLSRPQLEDIGADGAVLKPFDVMQLVGQIRAHVGIEA
jgi:CheY-like chemotaxis protein